MLRLPAYVLMRSEGGYGRKRVASIRDRLVKIKVQRAGCR
jgi:hypothetical protein